VWRYFPEFDLAAGNIRVRAKGQQMKYSSALNRIRNRVRGVFLLLGVCILLAGHNGTKVCISHAMERLGKGKCTYIMEEHITEAAPDDYDYAGNYPYIDYDYIEQYHEVLWHNIYAAPTNDYAGTPLAGYLNQIEERDREQLAEEVALFGHGTPLSIDYTVFDFNDDGLEDYLACFHGSRWNSYWEGEYKGNEVRVYIQREGGSLDCALSESRVHLHDTTLPDEHAPVAVLREKTEGYYSIVLPGQNYIWRYENGKYRACEIGEEYIPSGEERDVVRQGIVWEEAKYINITHAEMAVGIDYEYIEANHRILRHNICMTPRDDYNDTILEEYLRRDIEEDREMCSKLDMTPLSIDYFSFDFNDDGLEDYMVCYHGSLWSGSGGNHVDIYIQTRHGSLRRVFSVTMRLHNGYLLNAHAPVAVLDEKTDGFYAIVLPGSNRILRYDKDTRHYEFQERE